MYIEKRMLINNGKYERIIVTDRGYSYVMTNATDTPVSDSEVKELYKENKRKYFDKYYGF